MLPETGTPENRWPVRRWIGWGVAVATLIAVGWYFGFTRPADRAAAALAKERANNARSIPDLGLDLVWIAPGDFMMGTPGPNFLVRWLNAAHDKFDWIPAPEIKGDSAEWPQTYVKITKEFWLGRTEVTQAQWAAVMESDPSHFKGRDLPVEQVSRGDAMEFCRKLTVRERAAGRLPAGYAFTLPTEAQWEYACRAGTTGDYAGNFDEMAWYCDNSGRTTHPVGAKQPNAWGLFDMHGNVIQWCVDWYGDYPGGMVIDPTGPTSGSDYVTRGGCWFGVAARGRSASRNYGAPGLNSFLVGFRVALSSVP